MPRPSAPRAGLRGPGQEIWTEAMKSEIRSRVFIPEYVQVLRQEGENAGGSVNGEYEPVGEKLDGRLDNVGNAGGEAKVMGEQINESTTHILSLPPGALVENTDRFEVEGKVFVSTSESVRTDQATTQLQVKELHG